MRSTRWVVVAALAATAAASAAAVEGEGLVAPDAASWPRWQGRLSLGSPSPLFRTDTMNAEAGGLKVSAASLLGDYYFLRSLRGPGSGGGFRATSGLFVGARASSLLWAAQPTALSGRAFQVDRRSLGGLNPSNNDSPGEPVAVPYLGLGYTGMAGKGGWGFSADLGVMALSPRSAVKLGRVFSGSQSLDDALRDMRLSPLLQLGVSYSF